MKHKPLYLCAKCAGEIADALGMEPVPTAPTKAKCQNCGKAVYGTWYEDKEDSSAQIH